METIQDFIIKANELLEVQGSPGNWDFDDYMRGMYNGMEYMVALAEGREPIFKISATRMFRLDPAAPPVESTEPKQEGEIK